MKRKNAKMDDAVSSLAISASRVLAKFGEQNPDWQEWRDLKADLLKIMPHVDAETSAHVGGCCSHFAESLRKDLACLANPR